MLTVLSSSAHGTGGLSNGDHISDRWPGLPLKYLLPAILVPIVILGCCLVCCVKCCLHNEDCDEIRNCWRNKGANVSFHWADNATRKIFLTTLMVVDRLTKIKTDTHQCRNRINSYKIRRNLNSGENETHGPKANAACIRRNASNLVLLLAFNSVRQWDQHKDIRDLSPVSDSSSTGVSFSHLAVFDPNVLLVADKKKTLEIEETSSPGFHASYPYPSHHGHLALGQFEREPLNNPTPNQHFHQVSTSSCWDTWERRRYLHHIHSFQCSDSCGFMPATFCLTYSCSVWKKLLGISKSCDRLENRYAVLAGNLKRFPRSTRSPAALVSCLSRG